MTDLRYALRLVRNSPAFATVVILTLAIGIGANTALVGVLDTVLRRELPVQAPEELVFVRSAGARGLGSAPPYPYFDRIRSESSSFARMAAFAADELRIDVGGSVEQVFGQVASGTYFDVAGIAPAAGRLMSAADERLDPPVAVIGYGYWQRRFGGSPAAIGRTLSFRNRAFTIVGVTPPAFHGLEPGRQVDVTLPITLEAAMLGNRAAQWFNVVARLRPGVDPRQASAQVNASLLAATSALGRPGDGARERFGRVALTPAARGLDQLRTRFTAPLSVLTLVTGLLLLIACTNLAGLLLVRGAMRRRELALRLAAGANAGRLVRQLLTETLVLFVLGAAAGLFIAYAALEGLTGLLAAGRRPILIDVPFDWRIVGYALGVTFVTGILTGLWPAVRALRIEPLSAMKDNTAGPQRLRTRRLLLAAQVALSLALLVAAGLFARTMMNIRAVDLGFSPDGVLTMSVDPALPPDTDPGAREQLWARWLERVRGVPGVRAASLSVLTPLSGRNTGVAIALPGLDSTTDVRLNHVSEGYFRTFGIDLRDGRTFSNQDSAGAIKVAVLNETAAETMFPGRSPIGEPIQIGDSAVHQVVGIVDDYRHLSVREQPPPFVFVPLSQPVTSISRLTLSVSSAAPGSSVARAISDAVTGVYRGTLVSDVIAASTQVDETLTSERLLSALATASAVLVLALAAIGLYGIVSYTTATRTKEFGVRLALGASRSNLAIAVIGDAIMPVAVGIAAGLPLALIVARGAERLLFGVSPTDATTYACGAVVMLVVAAAAAWLPARRACGLEPAATLRG